MDSVDNTIVSMNDMNSKIESINVSFEKSTNNLGEIDDNISSVIKELMGVLNRGTHPFSNKEYFKILNDAITAHKSWVDKLKEIVENNKEIQFR